MSLTLDFQDNVAVLTHDDGKRNAFSPDAISDFNSALDEVEAKKAALTWVGREGCFSAGFDLKVMASGDAEAAAAMEQTTHETGCCCADPVRGGADRLLEALLS